MFMDSEMFENVIQTYGYYQNQIPTQHWMLKDDGLMSAWVALTKNKHGDAVLQDASGKQAYTQSTTVSRSVASKT